MVGVADGASYAHPCRYCYSRLELGAPAGDLAALRIATGCAIVAATVACVGTYLLKSGLKVTAANTIETPAPGDWGNRSDELPVG
jgi:hypothetical protein